MARKPKASAASKANVSPVESFAKSIGGDEPSRQVHFKEVDEPEVEVPDLTNNEPVSSKRARKPPVKFVSDPIRGAKKSTVTNGKRAGVTKESAPIFTEEDESIAPVMTKKVVGARKRKQLEENLMDEPDVELSPGKPEGAAMPVESERQKRKTKPEVSKSNVTEPETLFESNQSVEEEGGAKGKKKPTKKAKVAELAAGTEDKDAPAEVKEKETVRKPSAKASKKKTFEAQEKIDQAASMSGDENGRNTEDSEKPNSDGEETRVLAVQDKPKSKRGAVPKKSEPVVKATRAPRQVKKRNVEPEEPKNEVAALKSNSDEDDKEDEPEPEVVQLKKGRREAKLRTGKADKANVEIKEKTQTAKKSKKVTSANDKVIRIASWNVSGVRSCFAKPDTLERLMEQDVDILCFQEVRAEQNQVDEELVERLADYRCYWNSRPDERKGYAGVAIYSRFKPISVSTGMDHDQYDREGRILTLEFENFYLVNVYVPNAGDKLKRLNYKMNWDVAFRDYLIELDSLKPVIACGDFNVAHKEIDLANPKTNTNHAGFTPEEREDFTDLLDKGFIDTFRHLYPDTKDAYTFWSNRGNSRARNVGWRLDYFVVSERLQEQFEDSVMLPQIKGSDHCPIMLISFLHPEN